jgi:hypothetical protein
MRSVLLFVMLGTLLSLPGMPLAETNAECTKRCAAEKTERDESCMPGDESEKEHAECLRENQENYNNCVAGCPQPDPEDVPAETKSVE